jgi:DNA polymerase-3 subunit gamma/tau
MDKFIVSARKYRPQAFDTVVGQSHITTTLKNAIRNNQLAHAFLFCGPRGVGKTTCARILAKTINCENLQPDGEACNTCHSCKSFNEGTSLNIHELDAASNNSVDDIRSLVEQVRFAPQAGKYKVYIVDEVHMLSASAFNAFLKTLEEPPSYAIFILATTEKHKILPTILSRCQIFDFKRITTNDTVEHLEEIVGKEEISAEKAALQVIAQKSEGCMRDALSILDKIVSFTSGTVTYQNTLEHLNILDEDYYFRLLDCLVQQDMAGAMLLYDEINRKGFEGDLVLNGFAEFIRNLLVSKDAKAAALLDVVEGMQSRYTSAASNVSVSYLVSALNILNDAEINFKMARNKRLHVELCIIKLNFLQQAIELAADNNGAVVKKKRVDGPVAYRYKSLQSLQLPPSQKPVEEAKLYVEQLKQPKQVIQEPANQVQEPVITSKTVLKPFGSSGNGAKKSLLDVLKEKAAESGRELSEVKEAELLSMDKLQTCWNSYTEKLTSTSAMTFKTARLALETETTFCVTVNSLTQQKFIEQERMMLIDHVQRTFCNPIIKFSIRVEEGEKRDVPQHMLLNSRQRFEKIASMYPLVKELKDRLKLELDY